MARTHLVHPSLAVAWRFSPLPILPLVVVCLAVSTALLRLASSGSLSLFSRFLLGIWVLDSVCLSYACCMLVCMGVWEASPSMWVGYGTVARTLTSLCDSRFFKFFQL